MECQFFHLLESFGLRVLERVRAKHHGWFVERLGVGLQCGIASGRCTDCSSWCCYRWTNFRVLNDWNDPCRTPSCNILVGTALMTHAPVPPKKSTGSTESLGVPPMHASCTSKPLQVISVCSGICSEAAALKVSWLWGSFGLDSSHLLKCVYSHAIALAIIESQQPFAPLQWQGQWVSE